MIGTIYCTAEKPKKGKTNPEAIVFHMDAERVDGTEYKSAESSTGAFVKMKCPNCGKSWDVEA